MDGQASPIDVAARQFIEQCRHDIAAAWTHVEAAKDVLRRSRWLVERWAVQANLDQVSELTPANLSVRRRRSRGFIMTASQTDRRSRRRSASG